MSRITQTTGLGYVECDECGHPIEVHDRDGCLHTDYGDTVIACTCKVSWPERAIRAARHADGLPRDYNPMNLS